MAKKLKCGLIMPIAAIDSCSESHWESVREIIKEALGDTEFSVDLVSDSNEIGIIQKRIVQNIYENDIVICDVSAKNPNVMFELGMRLAFDKPAIIIKDDLTNYSFDTAPIEHLSYPRSLHYQSIQAFKVKLKEKTLATYEASKRAEYTTFLKHFGKMVVSKIDETEVAKDDYIFSMLNDLKSEMKSVQRMLFLQNHLKPEVFTRSMDLNFDSLKYSAKSDLNYLESYINKTGVTISALRDSSSAEFRNFFEAYVNDNLPDSAKMKDRHLRTTEEKLKILLSSIT